MFPEPRSVRVRNACTWLLVLVAFVLTSAARATQPSLAQRLDRAERFQDWAAVERLSRQFVLQRRADLYAITSILNGCVARGCDESAAVARLRGPLVSDAVREFARAWLDFVARDPGAARARFEALAREPRSAWLGAFGRLAYAAEARNAMLLREALRDARADRAIAAALDEDIRTADIVLASLEGDEARGAALASEGGETAGALMARFTHEMAIDDFAAARKTLTRYAELWGEDQDAVVSDIELARARRPPEEVVAQARTALAAHPRYWKLRFSLAQSLIEADEEAAAREILDKGFPTAFASVRLELAIARNGLGRVSGDETDAYARELRPFRDYPEAQAALAGAMVEAGRSDEAGALLDRADAMTDGLPATLNVRARMAREAGSTAEYLKLLERVAARSPGDVNAQLLLGFAYAKSGDSMKASGVAAALRHSPRYVRPDTIELLEKAARDVEPSFRTARAAGF